MAAPHPFDLPALWVLAGRVGTRLQVGSVGARRGGTPAPWCRGSSAWIFDPGQPDLQVPLASDLSAHERLEIEALREALPGRVEAWIERLFPARIAQALGGMSIWFYPKFYQGQPPFLRVSLEPPFSQGSVFRKGQLQTLIRIFQDLTTAAETLSARLGDEPLDPTGAPAAPVWTAELSIHARPYVDYLATLYTAHSDLRAASICLAAKAALLIRFASDCEADTDQPGRRLGSTLGRIVPCDALLIEAYQASLDQIAPNLKSAAD